MTTFGRPDDPAVHDELLFEAPESQARDVAELVRTKMESAAELTVPLTVDVGIGRNWKEAKADAWNAWNGNCFSKPGIMGRIRTGRSSCPPMRNKVVRFEVVDEEEWQQRLNAMLAG